MNINDSSWILGDQWALCRWIGSIHTTEETRLFENGILVVSFKYFPGNNISSWVIGIFLLQNLHRIVILISFPWFRRMCCWKAIYRHEQEVISYIVSGCIAFITQLHFNFQKTAMWKRLIRLTYWTKRNYNQGPFFRSSNGAHNLQWQANWLYWTVGMLVGIMLKFVTVLINIVCDWSKFSKFFQPFISILLFGTVRFTLGFLAAKSEVKDSIRYIFMICASASQLA